jgi:hypothetical protein
MRNFATLKLVSVPVAPVQHKGARDVIRSDYRELRSAAKIPEMSLQHKAFGEQAGSRVCATFRSDLVALSWRHAQRAIQSNDLTVEIAVAHHV